MAGNRGSGFWDNFLGSDDERSDEVTIIHGDILPEFYDIYDGTVRESDTYAEMNDLEKLVIAEEFMELFYYGGYSAADQEAWLALLGLYPHDFDWDEYASIYELVAG
jgi:hypothetical protein